jgi:hypothetical protein
MDFDLVALLEIECVDYEAGRRTARLLPHFATRTDISIGFRAVLGALLRRPNLRPIYPDRCHKIDYQLSFINDLCELRKKKTRAKFRCQFAASHVYRDKNSAAGGFSKSSQATDGQRIL